MRRRPMEFWWIAAFSVSRALLAIGMPLDALQSSDRGILFGYAGAFAFILAPVLLMFFLPIGRWSCAILLGIVGVEQCRLMLALNAAHSAPSSVLVLGFCLWMIFYLQRPSTAHLFTREAKAMRLRGPGCGLNLIDLLEVLLALASAKLVYQVTAKLWIAGSAGVLLYVVYGLLVEDWVRQRWAAFFSRLDAGFPTADAGRWRSACNALARKNFVNARRQINEASSEARHHAAGQHFLRMLDWHELLERKPASGREALRRSIYDHDFKPTDKDRALIADFIECSSGDAIKLLVEERAQLIEGLVRAGLNPNSFFYNRADRVLTRITGEAFAFNTHESWAQWWNENRDDWTGDAGMVSIVARLLHRDSCAGAHALATIAAGRAEEPMLKELTAQVLFLTSMQKAIREHDTLQTFIKQPQRMLLVPELSDGVGLLHADSPVLEEMGMPLQQVARRLMLRVPLIEYMAKLWQRYPNDLNADMPWLLPTLTGRSFGALRARAKFEAWWPQARESFIRHDRAVTAGLAAISAGDNAAAEKFFREALAEQPKELSSRYNLAICVMKRKAHAEAASLLHELTELEPKEPYWWMVLGDIHRTVNKSQEAYAAFRRALELGAAEGRVALHMGLTFARDERNAEAIQELDRALGNNPTASKIEALVVALESEGLWKLAGHYREEAMRRGLSGSDSERQDEMDGDAVA